MLPIRITDLEKNTAENFKQSIYVLPISVDQNYHEGEIFAEPFVRSIKNFKEEVFKCLQNLSSKWQLLNIQIL